MVFLGWRYYKVYVTFLSILGIWPSRKPFLKKVRLVTSYFLLLGVILCQVFRVLPEKRMKVIFRITCLITPSVVVFVKFYVYHTKCENVRVLLNKIADDWSVLTEEEIRIIGEYSNVGRLFGIYLASVQRIVI